MVETILLNHITAPYQAIKPGTIAWTDLQVEGIDILVRKRLPTSAAFLTEANDVAGRDFHLILTKGIKKMMPSIDLIRLNGHLALLSLKVLHELILAYFHPRGHQGAVDQGFEVGNEGGGLVRLGRREAEAVDQVVLKLNRQAAGIRLGGQIQILQKLFQGREKRFIRFAFGQGPVENFGQVKTGPGFFEVGFDFGKGVNCFDLREILGDIAPVGLKLDQIEIVQVGRLFAGKAAGAFADHLDQAVVPTKDEDEFVGLAEADLVDDDAQIGNCG